MRELINMMYYSWTYEMITSCMYVPATRQPLWQRHTAGGSHAIEKGVFEDTGSEKYPRQPITTLGPSTSLPLSPCSLHSIRPRKLAEKVNSLSCWHARQYTPSNKKERKTRTNRARERGIHIITYTCEMVLGESNAKAYTGNLKGGAVNSFSP